MRFGIRFFAPILATIHEASCYYCYLLPLSIREYERALMKKQWYHALSGQCLPSTILYRISITHTFACLSPCNKLERRLSLDGTSPTAPTAPSPTASQAGNDDIEAGDNAGDDSLQNGSDAVNDCHKAGPEGLEEGFDL